MTDRAGFRGDQRWWLVLGLVPTMLLIAPLLLAWPWAGRLPDPIAVHWGLDGTPNGTMSLAANQAFSAALALVFWVIGAVMVRNARAWRVRRSVATVTAGAIGFLSLLAVAVLRANLDQLSWRGAQLHWWSLPFSLVGAMLVGLGTWALAGRPPELDEPIGGVPLGDALPSAGLAPGARAAWEGTSSNGWLAVLGVVIGGVCLVAAPLVSWGLLLPGSLGLLACVTTSMLQVRCDGRGMVVRYGLLGWPVQRIALQQIAAAHAIDLDPLEWGGWGYRWAPNQNGTAAVTRRGPAIVIERIDGRRFAVTVDDALTGAGTLNDLRPTRPGR